MITHKMAVIVIYLSLDVVCTPSDRSVSDRLKISVRPTFSDICMRPCYMWRSWRRRPNIALRQLLRSLQLLCIRDPTRVERQQHAAQSLYLCPSPFFFSSDPLKKHKSGQRTHISIPSIVIPGWLVRCVVLSFFLNDLPNAWALEGPPPLQLRS